MATSIRKANKAAISTNDSRTGTVSAQLVYMNDGVRLCAEACACCWDKANPETYEEKVDYLGRRAKTGHLSIMEHSNVVILLKLWHGMDTSSINDIMDTLCAGHYLNCRLAFASDFTPYIAIGGTLRGYMEMMYLSRNSAENFIIRAICGVLYKNFDARLFYTMIEAGFMDEESFVGVEPDPASHIFNNIPDETIYEDEKVKVLNVDNKDQIKFNLYSVIGENIFDDKDISRLGSISILFKDMSRTATHQLVRHRNGMTQESQRYVDYSDAAFADPTSFKPDRYDPNKLYTFKFGGVEFAMTANEIGEAEIGIYEYLKDQGMLKEDARSFLPGNVKCRKLYMTFCFAHFEKFLELRTHKGAQAEIRSFAVPCNEFYIDYCEKNFTGTNIKKTTVDEIISDKEVIMQQIIDNEPELGGKADA